MLLSCPSKTFLLGEYLALKGEPCLVAGTEPRFQLRIREGERFAPFHPDSPAGRLWAQNAETTKNWSLDFWCALKMGGLGASSAQFLLLFTALQMQKTLAWEAQLEPDLQAILRSYADLSFDGGAKPSGADIVGQLKGNVTLFEKNRGRVESRGWGFEDLSFLLFATGEKVPTHEHLNSLTDWDESRLREAVAPGLQAWLDRDAAGFVESVRQARAALHSMGFEAATTTRLLGGILENPQVLAAKGCGALGADVLLIICEPKNRQNVQAQLEKRLTFIASNENLCEGLGAMPHFISRESHP